MIIAKNGDFELEAKQGVSSLDDFTGRIRFSGTDCEVEHASLVFNIKHPEYLEEGGVPWTPQAVESNFIEWKSGTVVCGDLRCKSWAAGDFEGDALHAGKIQNIVFRGKELNAGSIDTAGVKSGKVKCGDVLKCWFSGDSLDCRSWGCGVFEGGVFMGDWHEGYFKGGVFCGIWHGGVWYNGTWSGDSRVGDGTFSAIVKG